MLTPVDPIQAPARERRGQAGGWPNRRLPAPGFKAILEEEGRRLRLYYSGLKTEMEELWDQSCKLLDRGYKLREEGNKLCLEGYRLRKKRDKLRKEEEKMRVTKRILEQKRIIDIEHRLSNWGAPTSSDDPGQCTEFQELESELEELKASAPNAR